jgi:putative ABC transport system ATP-binding protein
MGRSYIDIMHCDKVRCRPVSGFRVELRGVGKRFETGDRTIAALDGVSLALDPGSVLGVTGPSGSGKSTLLHVVGAMDRADEGRIEVGEFAVHELDRREQVGYRRRIGFVFQHFHLLPALGALDNVAAPLLPYRVEFDKHERARELLAAVGLAGREHDLPSRLSGGEQQRVAIARALVNDPGLLLADEPTGNLDSETAAEIVQLLLDLRAERGMTVIVATHNPQVAVRCDRVARLHDGRLLDDVEVPRTVAPEEMLARISRIEP